jgi:hypothetical protein
MLGVGLAAEEPQSEETGQMPEMGPPQQITDMAYLVGEWTFKGRVRMEPESPWQDSEATVKCSYIAGGCAIQTEYYSMIMGMEMHGLGIMAYDRETKMWQETWVDNLAAHISYYTGEEQEGKRVVSGIEYWGGLKYFARNTTYDITDTEYKWTMENSLDGENWYVSMEGVYTKKK